VIVLSLGTNQFIVQKYRRLDGIIIGGFNSEVRRSVAEEDLIGSFCVEAFSWASIEF